MKKIVYSLVIIAGFVSNYVQALNVCDKHGRTKLMNYIISQEAKLANLKVELVSSHGKSQAQSICIQLNINRCLNETCQFIEAMVDAGARLELHDIEGKTALDFCKTKKFYIALRSLGAPFQLKTWASIYKSHFIASGIAFSIGVICLGLMDDREKLTTAFSELSAADNFKLIIGLLALGTVYNILESACIEEDLD